MKQHLQKWGAVYLIMALFLGSWVGQAVAQQSEIAEKGWSAFWAATFENWQSEFLQLAFQAVVLLGMKHILFKADAEDEERVEAKLETIITLLEEAKGQKTVEAKGA
jgi:hypothetical protein